MRKEKKVLNNRPSIVKNLFGRQDKEMILFKLAKDLRLESIFFLH